MIAVYSPTSNKAYFKQHGKLYSAPYNTETKIIDFEEVFMVDWFFLTPEEMEDAFVALEIMEEQEDEIR